ncbi:A-kinase anchor protein 4-like [Rhynchocyon petersi]
MSDHIDWLHSSRGVSKVHLYTPKGQQEQDRKKISFVDVSTLKMEDRDAKNARESSSQGDFCLENLEDEEIIVIKNNEKQHKSKTGGSVCLFKQAPFDPICALNFLLNDLQKYALGFQHILSPTASSCKHKIGASEDECHELPLGNCYSVFADQLNTDYFAKRPHSLRLEMAGATNTNDNQNSSTLPVKSPSSQRAVISPEGEYSLEDLSFHVNRPYSLIMQMASKEVTEKLEGGSKCSTGDKGKDSPCSVRSKIASEIAHDAVDATSTEMWGPGKDGREGSWKRFTCSQLSNSNKCRGQEMCQEDSKDFADSISKGLMVCVNQVASDMMVSIMRTLKCHSSERPVPAWLILKRVLLNHSKEIVSDLINSCMRNLHGITGDLMTDSEFVSAVKRNLFNHGKQNAAAIMDTVLKRPVSALLGEKSTKSQSLTSLKTGSHDHKCNNQSLECAMKAEIKGKGKVRPEQCTSLSSAEKVGEHLLKETLTRWKQNQGKRADKSCTNKEEKREKISPSTDSLTKDLIVSVLSLIQYHLSQQAKGKDSFEGDPLGSTMGYMTHSTQYEKCGSGQSAKALSVKQLESPGALGPSTALKENQQLDCLKVDMSKIVLSLLQKLLNESPFNCDISEGENKRSQSPGNKAASKRPDRREEGCQENQEHDFMSGMKRVNRQFVDKLVESVTKLCLFMGNYSGNEAVLAELEKQIALLNNPNYPAGSSKSGRVSSGSSQNQEVSELEVVVNNPCATGSFQKQLQAVLQWIAASQYNVPTLYFTGDDEGQLEKLPEVSAKAAEKGYSVGDLLQEVIKFAKERQLDETLGNMAKNQLLDWLLANL